MSDISPFVFVEEISLPFTVMLSIATDVSPAISVVVSPRFRLELPRVIAFAVTAPEVTVKSVESKLATPLCEEVAFSPISVRVVPVALVSIPSPPEIVKVSPRVAAALPESEERVTSFEATAPEVTVKFVALKLATPLLVSLASSHVRVKVVAVAVASLPAPPDPEITRMEYDMKDKLIRQTIMTTQDDVKEIKEDMRRIEDKIDQLR